MLQSSISYRLLGDNPPPTQPGESDFVNAVFAAVADAELAVNWMHSESSNLNVDDSRIMVGGFSAGAITSLILGMSNNVDVAAILDISGGLYDRISLVDPTNPPVFIVHGNRDLVVPYVQAKNLEAALISNDIPFGFPFINSSLHSQDLLDLNAGNQTVRDEMYQFYYDQLDLQDLTSIPEPTGTLLLILSAAFTASVVRRRKN